MRERSLRRASLLAAPAGYLADRFSKRDVIVGCKVAEIAIMVLGVAVILSGDVRLMGVVLFLMGAQSAIFSPSKLGSIPEIVRPERIAAALPVVATVPAKPKKRTLVGMFALGAAVAYFFDPASGAARRDAVKQRISGLVKRGAPGDNVPGE